VEVPGDSERSAGTPPSGEFATPIERQGSALHQLMQTVAQRRKELPQGSYTTQLFQAGNQRISAKVAEESAELIEAAERLDQSPDDPQSRTHMIYEAVDLVYHTWVLLGYHRISMHELEEEIRRRFGTSGLAEKGSRPTR